MPTFRVIQNEWADAYVKLRIKMEHLRRYLFAHDLDTYLSIVGNNCALYLNRRYSRVFSHGYRVLNDSDYAVPFGAPELKSPDAMIDVIYGMYELARCCDEEFEIYSGKLYNIHPPVTEYISLGYDGPVKMRT